MTRESSRKWPISSAGQRIIRVWKRGMAIASSGVVKSNYVILA